MSAPVARNSRLPDPTTLDAEQRAVADQVRAGRGRLPTPFRVWLANPRLAGLLHPLGQFLADATSLTPAEREIAVLAAAQRWGAGYLLAAHAQQARAAGLDEEVVAALAGGRPARPHSERQQAVAAMMTALADDGAPSDQVFATAVANLGHAGVAEVLAIAGYFTAVGLAMKMYAVEPPS